MNRAYSIFEIKSFDESARTFEGVATTPVTDRQEDIVEPLGGTFKLPLPMMWQHGKGTIKDPVGAITAATVGPKGITVKGYFANLTDPPSLKEDLDRAWALVKAKLVRGLSIGFRELESEPIKGTFGMRIKRWEWLELSPVAIAANQEAMITTIKSLDQQQRAASGADRVVRLIPPGVSGRSQPETRKGTEMKTTAEQLAEFDLKRKAAIERIETILQGAESRTLDETESEEFDNLQADVKSIDVHLARLKSMEAIMVAKATPVTAGGGSDGTSHDLRGGNVLSVRRNVEKGTAFTRYTLALMMTKGNLMHAERMAEERWKDTPEVALVLKAAVAAGTTQATTWAAPLVQYNDMAGEFIELLRPMTILGKMTGVRRVPFNIRIARQTAGVSGSFVGEGQPKPVNALAFDNITLGWAKAAVIVVLTDELVRFSNPSAEALVRADMLNGISTYLDRRFIDPSFAGVANVSPASITNGITPRASTGSTVAAITADVKAVLTAYANSNQNLATAVWVMAPKTALALSMMRNVNDEFIFPTINVNGGSWMGFPVITSNAVGLAGSPTDNFIALIDQSEVLLADDGGISIDMSQEASVEMNDAPTGGATSLVSLWQNNLLGLRAERYINWTRRRATVASWINDTNY